MQYRGCVAACQTGRACAACYPDAMQASPTDLLRRVFGHEDFRGPQRAIVEHIAAGGDALVLMPTGGGKSLCYQVPALLRDGVGVVEIGRAHV